MESKLLELKQKKSEQRKEAQKNMPELERNDFIKLRKLKWLRPLMKARQEDIYLSYGVKLYNKYGVMHDRYLTITNRHLYHVKVDFARSMKSIPLEMIDGLTISGEEQVSLDGAQPHPNGELVVHVTNSHDRRYRLGAMRDTVADLIRRLRLELKETENAPAKPLKLYRVMGRTILKKYQTQKYEAFCNAVTRPEEKYEITDAVYE